MVVIYHIFLGPTMLRSHPMCKFYVGIISLLVVIVSFVKVYGLVIIDQNIESKPIFGGTGIGYEFCLVENA